MHGEAWAWIYAPGLNALDPVFNFSMDAMDADAIQYGENM